MAWYDEIVDTTKGNVQGLVNALRNPVDTTKQFLKGGEKNRKIAAALLQGDTAPLKQAFANMTPQDMENAMVNAGVGFAGTINPIKSLSALEQNILNKGGDYALQRFQKAKSLVPDLEKQYTNNALERLFTQEDMYGLTVMNPSEFENFAAPLRKGIENIEKYSKIQSGSDEPFLSYKDYMQYLKDAKNKTGFTSVPYLHLNKTETGLPLPTFISGHEGRHRTRVLNELGNNPTLVQLQPRGALYKDLPTNISDYGLPINTQKEFVDALNKEMSLNKDVRPQTWMESDPNSLNDIEIRRPNIRFPNEIFGVGMIPFVDYKKNK